MKATQPPERVGPGRLAWTRERLSDRDRAILQAVNHLHLATGLQIDRLFFQHMTGRSRIVTRSNSLSRLVNWRVLYALPRRIGGAMRGSSVAIYAIGSVGKKLLAEQESSVGIAAPKIRKASIPGERFTSHVVAVSELYVQLVEAHRVGSLVLRQFTTEPSSWWPNSHGGWLKPDAFFTVSNGRKDHLYWWEHDRATESVPTVARKLGVYVDFVNRGGVGPRQSIPRVVVSVPHVRRQDAVAEVVRKLPSPGQSLVSVVTHDQAVPWLITQLNNAV